MVQFSAELACILISGELRHSDFRHLMYVCTVKHQNWDGLRVRFSDAAIFQPKSQHLFPLLSQVVFNITKNIYLIRSGLVSVKEVQIWDIQFSALWDWPKLNVCNRNQFQFWTFTVQQNVKIQTFSCQVPRHSDFGRSGYSVRSIVRVEIFSTKLNHLS